MNWGYHTPSIDSKDVNVDSSLNNLKTYQIPDKSKKPEKIKKNVITISKNIIK
jgi:hypothetical protein